mgnify:CR=1 FL=1
MVFDYNTVKYEYGIELYDTYKKLVRGVCQKIRHINQLCDLSILDEIVLVYYTPKNLDVIVCINKDCPYMSKMIKVSNHTMETKCCQERYPIALIQKLFYDSRFVIVSSLKEVVI